MIELTIMEPTPGLNAFIYRHWRSYYHLKKDWYTRLWIAALEAKCGKPRLPKAKVTIERYSRGTLDEDNFRGGLKPVIDGLKSCGLIEDDSHDHITVDASQHRGRPYRTVIRIEQLTGA